MEGQGVLVRFPNQHRIPLVRGYISGRLYGKITLPPLPVFLALFVHFHE